MPFSLALQRPLAVAAVLATALSFVAPVPAAEPKDLLHVSSGAGPPVTLTIDPTTFTLDNGRVIARVDKRSGDLVSLQYQGVELLGRGSGHPFAYWSFVGGGDGVGRQREATVKLDPAINAGERAIVSCMFRHDGGDRLPCDVEICYALGRGKSGLHTWSVWSHEAGDRGFSIAEARFAAKLNPDLFDFLTVDAERRRKMPTGEDWDQGKPLALKEARQMTTGVRTGEVEHKYDYSAPLFETPAYGWTSSERGIGLWMLNPSHEYMSGGPTKVELTGHLDVNRGGNPVLLNMWKGSHYGSSSLAVAEDEAWSKFVGPFLLYCNSGENHETMWRDAVVRADAEKKKWPYPWIKDPDYPTADERGAVTGQIQLEDPLTSQENLKNLLVGLAPPDYEVRGRRRDVPVDWQLDAKGYQFWVRADAEGRFRIPHVRPGNYTLHAIADGVLGELAVPGVEVSTGRDVELGELNWKPVRHGRQLWEIGIADRTAGEFRHGDEYWQWGLWERYPEEFPNDVNFVIGESDPRIDWNYAQPPRMIDRRRVESTTWKIRFRMPEVPEGQATLRLAIAGSRTRQGIEVAVNDTPVGGTGPLPDTGTMHRDGIRGYWCERAVSFDAALLQAGENELTLHVPATSWTEGVLYDYLRLEVDEAAERGD